MRLLKWREEGGDKKMTMTRTTDSGKVTAPFCLGFLGRLMVNGDRGDLGRRRYYCLCGWALGISAAAWLAYGKGVGRGLGGVGGMWHVQGSVASGHEACSGRASC
jgi:hypothetical protein